MDLGLAPHFSLPDHLGGQFSLPEDLGAAPLLLIFFRGHWCPYCRRYLCKLQENYDRLRDHGGPGTRIVAISPETPDLSRRLAGELKLQFLLLSDTHGIAIQRYGVRNTLTSGKALLPHPAVFIVDPLANLRFRSLDRNYKKRATMRSLFIALDALNPRPQSLAPVPTTPPVEVTPPVPGP